jgi:hypothetical protein
LVWLRDDRAGRSVPITRRSGQQFAQSCPLIVANRNAVSQDPLAPRVTALRREPRDPACGERREQAFDASK